MAKLRPTEPVQIERSAPRALFADLLAGALQRLNAQQKLNPQPSPMAIAYLIELLDERVLVNCDGLEGEQSLAEALLLAQREDGMDRFRRMRGLGDHALFVSGFLADNLIGSGVDVLYYRQIGCSAYGDVVSGLRGHGESGSWARLFGELAERFGEFVDLLAEIGDRTRPDQPQNLLGIYERYLLTGSARDRDRLLKAGHLPPDRSGLRWWQ